MGREDGFDRPLDAAAREDEGIHVRRLRLPRLDLRGVVTRRLEENAHDVDAVEQRVVVAEQQCRLAVRLVDDVGKQMDLPHGVADVQLDLGG